MRKKKTVIFTCMCVTVLAFFILHLFPELREKPKKPPDKHPFIITAGVREKLTLVNQSYQNAVKPIFQNKCFNCHSSQTQYPWFYPIPFIKALVDWDIELARTFIKMDHDYPFSSNYDFMEQLYEIETVVQHNKMPLTRYRWLNRGSKLTPEEKQHVLAWVASSKKILPPSYEELLDTSKKLQLEAASFKPNFKDRRAVPFPENNQPTAARIALGKKLFFDANLSGSGKISCATCHAPEKYWSDGLKTGIGHEGTVLKRHSPSLMNVAWASSQFWDGRAVTLEEQALGPIASPDEMNRNLDKLIHSIRSSKDYRDFFREAYPNEPITADTLAKALASFERTMESQDAAFDRWMRGNNNAISDLAKKGFVVFNTKANCVKCHTGWRFTDDSFQDIGSNDDDLGRGAVLDMPSMNHTFKTPTLRNVDLTGPYNHDGALPTLEKVIDFYNRGGDIQRETVAQEIKPLYLTEEEKMALVEFLKTLTEKRPKDHP